MSLRNLSFACFVLSIGLAVTLPGLVSAQTPPDEKLPLPGGPASGAIVFDRPQKQALETAEDIEIFGHLLRDALQAEYKKDTWYMMYPTLHRRPAPGDVAQPLAVHLPDHGVVYQLTAPHPADEPEPIEREKADEEKPLSRWEKARRELLGQQSPQRDDDQSRTSNRSGGIPGIGMMGGSGGMEGMSGSTSKDERTQIGPTKDQVVDALLNILAENGRHFRHLAEDDRLTVAITFRSEVEKLATLPAYQTYKEAVRQRNKALQAWREAKATLEQKAKSEGESGPTLTDESKARDEYYQWRKRVEAALQKLSEQISERLSGGEMYGRMGGMTGSDMAGEMGMESGFGEFGGSGAYGGEYGAGFGKPGLGLGGGYGAESAEGFGGAYGGAFPGSGKRESGNQEIQGDLHMRQGDYQKAMQAYRKALDNQTNLVKERPVLQSKEGRDVLKKAKEGDEVVIGWKLELVERPLKPEEQRLARKYIQAQIGAGNLDTAQQLLTALKEAEARPNKPAEDGTGKPRPPAAPKCIPLPVRLIVSVTKADCDAVAAGKITQEQFRQNAAVHDFNPAALRGQKPE